jgi:hypothetical protein
MCASENQKTNKNTTACKLYFQQNVITDNTTGLIATHITVTTIHTNFPANNYMYLLFTLLQPTEQNSATHSNPTNKTPNQPNRYAQQRIYTIHTPHPDSTRVPISFL